MEWGKEEERECVKAGVVQVASQVKLKNGKKGRILSCPADCTGRIGSKVRLSIKYIQIHWLITTKNR
jgi:N-acetyltransferase